MFLVSVALTISTLAPLAYVQGPQSYCTAGTSTSGCTPSMSASAQPNTANAAGCLITTAGVAGQRQGIIFYGVDNAGFTPTPWASGSTSFRCVKSPTKRMGLPQGSGGTAGQCDGSFVINWDAFQAANPLALGNPWVAGDKVYLQSWYRDPMAPKTSNLSNALELTMRDPVPVPCTTTIPGMVMVSGGAFDMGSDAPNAAPYFNTARQKPVHQVTISYCFWMGETEVTQTQYSTLMGANPSQSIGANNPVEFVSWFDARAYCAALTAQQSALGLVPPGYEFRLPTEAEWEYACRAGTATEFNVGSGLFCNQASFWNSYHSNSYCNISSTAPTRSFAPNPLGLYEMHGNVWEWCLDSFENYSAGALIDPFVTGGVDRVVRGGGWSSSSSSCRSAIRGYFPPSILHFSIGFRVVLAPTLAP